MYCSLLFTFIGICVFDNKPSENVTKNTYFFLKVDMWIQKHIFCLIFMTMSFHYGFTCQNSVINIGAQALSIRLTVTFEDVFLHDEFIIQEDYFLSVPKRV